MRIFWRLVAVLVVVGLGFGVLYYEHPEWVMRQGTHLGLFFSRVQSNYVMTPEGRIHYYEAEPRIPGGGVPLVLVHGLADRDESWAPMLKRLKRAGFHVYALDLLGAGRSPAPADSDYSIATQEQLVADFIQSLGLQKPDVGGWSSGGWIVLKLALDHPDMVDRVVVYDSAGLKQQQTGKAEPLFRPQTEEDVQELASALGARKLPGFVARDALRRLQGQQWVTDRAMASMADGKDTLDDRLSKLQSPLLIVWGADDKLLAVGVGMQMHQLDPRSELDIMEGCGHLAPKTCAPRVAAATADFLKAVPAPMGQVRTLAKMR
jgi:pimeloyl-ACP methyl ester carboxylesterase